MKRYDGYILRFINHEGGATQQEPAEVYLASEVDNEKMREIINNMTADSLKDMAEIARLKRALKDIRTEIKNDLVTHYTLTGILNAIEIIAREALEGK